jgi:hypothetical protein
MLKAPDSTGDGRHDKATLRAPDGAITLAANVMDAGELRIAVERRGVWNGVLLDADGHVKRVVTETASYEDLKTALRP